MRDMEATNEEISLNLGHRDLNTVMRHHDHGRKRLASKKDSNTQWRGWRRCKNKLESKGKQNMIMSTQRSMRYNVCMVVAS